MGRLKVNSKPYKIYKSGNIAIPTLLSSAGNSQDYVFSETDNIYFEAEIYLNSYDAINPIIGSTSGTYGVVNEYVFGIGDTTGVGDRGIPIGAFFVYNGERGNSLSLYYTSVVVISLLGWNKVRAERTNGNWRLFVNNIECAVDRFTDDGVPNDQFGNINLPVYIGRDEVSNINFDGQIRGVSFGKASNKISIKKSNLGTGKINLSPKKYVFVATGSSSPNINNLRFYDAGLIQDNQPIYNDETKTYRLAYAFVSNIHFWFLDLISVGGANGTFYKTGSISPIGSYSASIFTGSVTISAI